MWRFSGFIRRGVASTTHCADSTVVSVSWWYVYSRVATSPKGPAIPATRSEALSLLYPCLRASYSTKICLCFGQCFLSCCKSSSEALPLFSRCRPGTEIALTTGGQGSELFASESKQSGESHGKVTPPAPGPFRPVMQTGHPDENYRGRARSSNTGTEREVSSRM
jgi:hypothetical protein